MQIKFYGDGQTRRFPIAGNVTGVTSVTATGSISSYTYADGELLFATAPTQGVVITVDCSTGSSGGSEGGGDIVGEVIDYFGTSTPEGYTDVDTHPLTVTTNGVTWGLRQAPGAGAASILRGSFCAVGNKLFCVMWNGSSATDGSNVKAAVTLDSNDLETFTLRNRIPLLAAGVNGCAATALNADQVLVVFSSTSYGHTYSYIYTLSTDSWTWVTDFQTGATYPGLSACTLASGKVLVVAYSGVAKVFNPSNWTWATTGAMTKTAGQVHTMADGRVLLTGAKFDLSSSTAAIYTEGTNSWSATFATPIGLKMTAAFNLADGRVAVSGGNVANSYYVLNPTNLTWVANTFNFNKGTTANNHTAIATLPSGRVLVCWGLYNGVQGSFGDTNLTWTGWHMLEFMSTDITRFSTELRKIAKVA